MQISSLASFLSTIVILDIHNIILPRTNNVTFTVHVYRVSHCRFSCRYLQWEIQLNYDFVQYQFKFIDL